MQPICTDVLKTSKILYRTRRSWIDLEERSSVKWGHNPSSLLLSSYYSFPLIIPHSFYFSCLSSRPHFSRPFLFPILLGSLFLSIHPPHPPPKKKKEKKRKKVHLGRSRKSGLSLIKTKIKFLKKSYIHAIRNVIRFSFWLMIQKLIV